MNLMLTEEEEEVASAAALLLTRTAKMSRDTEREMPGSVASTGAWQLMADAGWFSLGVPLEKGGSGGSIGELAVFFREVGRSLSADPILGTVLAAQIAAESDDSSLFDDLKAGALKAAIAWTDNSNAGSNQREHGNSKSWYVSGAHSSTSLVMLNPTWAGILLGNFDKRTLVDGIDPGCMRERMSGDFRIAAMREGDYFYWLTVTLLAAMLVGVSERGRDQSVAYAKDRKQFDQPIGAFQAVKHRCADMAVRSDSAWSLTCYAAALLAKREPSAHLSASSAKLIAARSAIQNAADNVQNHGAMGFTDELGAHRLLRRAHALDNTLVQSMELLELLRRS